jgi:protein O-mannosyl-transferase
MPDASPRPQTNPACRVAPPIALRAAAMLVVLVTLAAYRGSFSVPFVFDDHGTIVENTTIRGLASGLHPPEEGMPVTGRPVANLSFALNYAASGLDLRRLHATNLLIHILGALTLMGIVRRTLQGRAVRAEPGPHADPALPGPLAIAFAAALIWSVHPLQTESVTYLSQRVESLMGLFYLLTLYCFIRYAETGRSDGVLPGQARTEPPSFVPRCGTSEGEQAWRGIWPVLSVGACLLGMGTKEVMATAPLVVLLYDRTFAAGSFRGALRLRGRYYAALGATWLLLAALLATTGSRGGTAGFSAAIPWNSYAYTQFRAIAHYLRLSVWPRPLVFFYGSALGGPAPEMAADIVVVCALVLLAAWGLRRRTALGFAGAAFFLILAPSSSVVPVATETIAEHRMYLPLAVPAVLAALGLARLASFATRGAGARIFLFWAVVALAAGWLGGLTVERNRDYAGEETLWRSTVAAFPGNEIAQYNLALMAGRRGRPDEAIAHYREALRIRPNYPEARNNLGRTLADKGLWDEAIAQYREAISEDPGFGRIHYNLGSALLHVGHLDEAISTLERSVRLEQDNPDAWYDLGTAYVRAGRDPDAEQAYLRAIDLRPASAQAQNDLATTLARMGRMGDALRHYEAAVRLQPGNAVLQANLGYALLASGRPGDAVAPYGEAVRLDPGNAEFHNNLGYALARVGRFGEARVQFEAVLRLKPDDADARSNLGRLPP